MQQGATPENGSSLPAADGARTQPERLPAPSCRDPSCSRRMGAKLIQDHPLQERWRSERKTKTRLEQDRCGFDPGTGMLDTCVSLKKGKIKKGDTVELREALRDDRTGAVCVVLVCLSP